MKRIIITILVLVFMIPVSAQITDQEAKLVQDAFGVDKKEMLMMHMALPEAQGEKFWPMYDSYAEEKKKLGMDRYQILKDYADSYPDLSAEMADDLTTRLFKNTMAIEKLQLKYYNKMKKAVGPLRASQFIQAEKYIESVMRTQLQNSIPFIGEMGQMRG